MPDKQESVIGLVAVTVATAVLAVYIRAVSSLLQDAARVRPPPSVDAGCQTEAAERAPVVTVHSPPLRRATAPNVAAASAEGTRRSPAQGDAPPFTDTGFGLSPGSGPLTIDTDDSLPLPLPADEGATPASGSGSPGLFGGWPGDARRPSTEEADFAARLAQLRHTHSRGPDDDDEDAGDEDEAYAGAAMDEEVPDSNATTTGTVTTDDAPLRDRRRLRAAHAPGAGPGRDSFWAERAGQPRDGGDAPRPPAYRGARRSSVWGVSMDPVETRRHRPEHHAKSAKEVSDLLEWLRRNPLFAHLDKDELTVVVNALERRTFARGEFITTQGEILDTEDQRRFYIVGEGEVAVIKDGTVLRALRPGSCFSERHVMFVHDKCRFTHRVESPQVACFTINAEQFRHTVTHLAVVKKELYEGFLDRVPWLRGLTPRDKVRLADCLEPVEYNDGEYLIEFDTVGQWLYVIVAGEVGVFGRREGEVVFVCSFAKGDCVGELEFLNHHRTVADVRARGRVKAARLHRDHFELCLGPIKDVLRRSSTEDERFAYYRGVLESQQTTADQGGWP